MHKVHGAYSIVHGEEYRCTGDWTDFEVCCPEVPEWYEEYASGDVVNGNPVYCYVPLSEVVRVCGIDPRPRLIIQPVTIRWQPDRPKVYVGGR